MTKKALLPQAPMHIYIYDEDRELLKALFGPTAPGRHLGVSGAIRQIIHQKCLALREEQIRKRDARGEEK